MIHGYNDETKEKVEMHSKSEVDEQTSQVNTKITALENKQWKWAFNLAIGEVKYIDFTDSATSTLLVLTQHDTDADKNSLFLVRKTASDNQDAMILGNAAGITQSDSATMPVRATVVEVQRTGGTSVKRLAIISQYGGSAIVYYQVIE